MHYFKRNIGDYHKKAGRLTMLQHGAYTLLMDACYDRERFPTLDEAIDWCWASTEDEVNAVKFVLGKFFELVDGRYRQARIQEEIDDFHRKSETNRRIALEREAKRTSAKRDVQKNARNVVDPSPDVNEPPPNQEPRTNNQEPEDIEEAGASSGGKPARFDPLALELPEAIPRQSWHDWIAYRRKRKLSTTEQTARAQLAKLAEWAAAGHRAAEVIEHSITNGWQGLFEPKAAARRVPARENFAAIDYGNGIQDL
jgi:uncharacterized protein YdaU (DUF1376 family)